MRFARWISLLLVLFVAAGCSRCDDDTGLGTGSGTDDMGVDGGGLDMSLSDGGTAEVDSGVDAGDPTDLGMDGGTMDAGEDAGTDAGMVDAGDDAGTDAGGSCGGVTCAMDEVCVDDVCYAECIDDDGCTAPEYCYNGLCSEDPCLGSMCPTGEACRGGECFPECTAQMTCSDTSLTCLDGACVSHPCDGYFCPPGQICDDCSPIAGQASGTLTMMDNTISFTFDAQEGELITLLMALDGIGEFELFDPDYNSLEVVPASSTDDGWLPYRIPATGTYTVTIAMTTPGDYTLDLTRYGLETPTVAPWHSETVTLTTGMNEDFLFFAEQDDAFAVDLIADTSTFSFGNVEFERLDEPGVWQFAGNESVGANTQSDTFASASGDVGSITGKARGAGIFRARVSTQGGPGTADIHYHKLSPASSLRVDSAGTCAGFDTGIPRLAAAAAPDNGVVEICDGTHVEHATVPLIGTGITLRGLNNATLVSGAGFSTLNNPVVVEMEGTDLTIEDLTFETAALATAVTYDDITDNAVIRNVIINGPTAGTTELVFLARRDTAARFDQLLVEDVTLVGQSVSGLVYGDDVTIRRFDWTQPYFRSNLTSLEIRGDGAIVEDSDIGTIQGAQPSVNYGIFIEGDGATVRGNTFRSLSGALVGSQNDDLTATVEGNTLEVVGFGGFGSHAIHVQRVESATVVDNYVSNYGDVLSTLFLQQSGGVVQNNRLRGDSGDGIHYQHGNSGTTPRAVVIANNTVELQGASQSQAGVYVDVSTSVTSLPQVEVFNNIVKAPPLSAGTPMRVQCGFEFSHSIGAFDYNLIDGFHIDYCGSASAGANDVVATTTLDADLGLVSPNPAIDAGTAVGAPTTDFEGDPRPSGTGFDIGADEF